MCVKDEADLLPEVYPHIRSLVDYVYAYDDGSQDETWEYIKDSDYAFRKVDDKNRLNIYRPNYHHLLEKIREDFKNEEVWIIITMGDRFFLNKTPRQIVEYADEFLSVEGVQLDFLRHRAEPWTEENDTFPNYNPSLREQCRWVKFDERCIVAYKLTNECSYLKSKYPWPKSIGVPKFGYTQFGDLLDVNMPFLEHQGRRSPKAYRWRHLSGSRPIGQKYKDSVDLSSFDAIVESNRRFYSPYRVFPWVGLETLKAIIEWENLKEFENRVNKRWFFKGMEVLFSLSGKQLPLRSDL